ncbi:MAG: ABC transporter ATP-binding protein [Pseudomonadota bacterium]
MLEIKNLEITYHDVILVVKGVSLTIKDGDMVALLGANGAGKSTILKAISGVLEVEDGDIEEGSIEFDGIRINNKESHFIVKKGLVQVPEGRRIFDELTVEENIRIGSFMRKDRRQIKEDFEKVLKYFPVLPHLRHRLAGYLSGGEQQMLAIGRAMMAKPRLLMLDEPSLGLAPIIAQGLFEIVKTFNSKEGVSVLLVEQNASMALEIVTYGYILENGKIVLDGPSHKLVQNPDVKEFYLGLTDIGGKKSYREIKHYKRRKRWLS